jgi:HD-like signal output (HDOD) protein
VIPLFSPDEVVRALQHLPTTPHVLPRLKRLLGNANSSMQEVIQLVRIDPGITARVLRLGNSAYYGRGQRCYTVDEAVTRVGYGQIYELVAHAVASQVLVRPLEVYALETEELWHQSIACALGAELLAQRVGADRDICYTVGLLHAVGMVAIDEWAFRVARGLRFISAGVPLECAEAERSTLGFNQAEIGAALLRLWDFPPAMAEPVHWQYAPGGTVAFYLIAVIVHVAKWLRTVVCHPTVRLPLPDRSFLQVLQLSPAHLTAMIPRVRTKLHELQLLLEVPVDSSVPFPSAERTIIETRHQRDCAAS